MKYYSKRAKMFVSVLVTTRLMINFRHLMTMGSYSDDYKMSITTRGCMCIMLCR